MGSALGAESVAHYTQGFAKLARSLCGGENTKAPYAHRASETISEADSR